MKKLCSLVLLSLVVFTATAQQKVFHDANAEKRSVASFHAVKVSHGIELQMQQGGEEALAVSADKKEHSDAVKTEVVNGELRIYIEQKMEKWWQQLRNKGIKVKAYVSFKNLDRINGSSGARIHINGHLKGDKLSVNLSSGARLEGELALSQLEVDQSSGARSEVKGQAQSLDVEVSSGAHYNGYDLAADKVEAEASSGGKIELSVNKELAASASSGGGISYKGNASVTNSSTSSGGKVRKAG